jgi:WhiB family redox-sensing transcriptional regulator
MNDWRHDAACREATPEAAEGFFAFDNEAELIAAAKQVCAGCPVTEQCRTWAMDHGQDHGVWGGLTADERRALRRNQGTTKRVRRVA